MVADVSARTFCKLEIYFSRRYFFSQCFDSSCAKFVYIKKGLHMYMFFFKYKSETIFQPSARIFAFLVNYVKIYNRLIFVSKNK